MAKALVRKMNSAKMEDDIDNYLSDDFSEGELTPPEDNPTPVRQVDGTTNEKRKGNDGKLHNGSSTDEESTLSEAESHDTQPNGDVQDGIPQKSARSKSPKDEGG